MSDDLRFGEWGFREFEKGDVLRAEELNAALRSGKNFALLCAAAPSATGLFRPWWWPADKPVNEIKVSEDKRAVELAALFVSLKSGTPMFVESEWVNDLEPEEAIVLTTNGIDKKQGGGCPGGEALVLATLQDGDFEIVAPVATLDATEELRRRNLCVIEAAKAWRDVARRKRYIALAQAFGALVRGGSLRQRMGMLSDVAGTLHGFLWETWGGGDDDVKVLENLRLPPPDSHNEISKWLKSWAKTFGDEKLRNRFFYPSEWRDAEDTKSGVNVHGFRRWRVDLTSSQAKMSVELEASTNFDGASWRFGNSGNVCLFKEVGRRTEGEKWRLTLPKGDGIPLFVWTKATELRWRLNDVWEE